MKEELQQLLDKARTAQAVVEHWSQEKVDEMVLAAAWEAIKPENAAKCAEMAVKETKMDDRKNSLAHHAEETITVLITLLMVLKPF